MKYPNGRQIDYGYGSSGSLTDRTVRVGEDYTTSIVRRGNGQQMYVYAKAIIDGMLVWKIRDDLSCPVTCDPLLIIEN